jgi:hypothetical protein
MGKDKPRDHKALEVSVTFEPSRISSDCLAEAYERIVAITRARTRATRDLTQVPVRSDAANRKQA